MKSSIGKYVLGGLAGLAFATSAIANSADNELRETAKTLFGTVNAASADEINDPKAVLGQALFWDMRLSANGKVACASCHFQENWGSDSRPRSIDARGRKTLQSQTVFHSQDTPGLRWLADRASGAAQAIGSITGSMGFAKREDILPVLAEHGYADLFQKAFPEQQAPMTPDNYGAALEVYQKTLRTPAPLSQASKGADKALTETQKKGLKRFMETGCVGCHNGPLVGGTMMQRFGVVENYWPHTGSPDIDSGLMRNTGKEEDRFFFRVPMLRNIAKTEPYFHDGSVANLKRATEIMAKVQLGQTLDDDALNELVAFQESLTGQIPANFAPPAGIPFELPEGVAKK
jgi:cytochrome c peroxidase